MSKTWLAGSEYLRPSPHPPGVLGERGITISDGLLVGDQSFTQYDGGYCTRSAAYSGKAVDAASPVFPSHVKGWLSGGVIEQLGPGGRMAEEEPLVEFEDLGDDEHRGRELEVSLREDIGHGHNRVVKALKQEDGITGVIREDREVHLVATPTRTDRLREWVSSYRKDKIRD